MKYVQIDNQEAIDRQLPNWEMLVDDYTGNYGNAIYRVHNGEWEFIDCDGGEPEDQFLHKAWGWVVDALNDALNEGHRFGVDGKDLD